MTGPRWGLSRYVAAATLARSADGGGVVAVVLIVSTSGGPGWLAGLLGASITAPHLLGPLLARRLDTAQDGRDVIAAACLLHGAGLAAAVLAYPHVPAILTAVLLMLAGLTGPFLTGGISSRLPAIAGPSQTSQRRAQGWDVATYGLGGTIGPTVVAIVSVAATPTIAALCLAAATAAAAALVRLLPPSEPTAAGVEVPRPLATLRILVTTSPLRRTLCLTMTVALSVAVLPIVAVASTADLDQAAGAAGALTAAYGLGSLAGSVGVMVRPIRGSADTATTALALLVAAALVVVLLAPGLTLAVIAYGAAGIANAYFFAATLAARSEHAPREARGQVFVWVGALKITAGSAGTAAAGAVIGAGAHLPIAVAVVATSAAAAASVLDRRSTR